ncbi:hypothetical protein Tco_1176062 [Tanacetum coccineum]
MEYEFVALAAAGKEAEWLKNLLFKIPLWIKPITAISIRCDSSAILFNCRVQFIPGNGARVSRNSGLKDIRQSDGFSCPESSASPLRSTPADSSILKQPTDEVYSEPLLWVSNPYLLPLPGALSQRIEIGDIGLIDSGILKSKFFNHSASLPAAARATNSYSIIELVIQVYFLEAQEIAPCHGDEGGGESWRSLSIDLHNALSLQALQVTDTGCRLFPVVGLLFLQFPGQMTYPVANLTLDSTRFLAFYSIDGDHGYGCYCCGLLGDPVGLFYPNRLGICIPPRQGIIGISLGPMFLLGLPVLAMLAACASRKKIGKQATTLSTLVGGIADTTEILEFKTSRDRYGDNGVSDPIGGLVFKDVYFNKYLIIRFLGDWFTAMVALTITSDEFYDEDGDFRKGDSIGVSMYLGGEILLGEERSLRNQTLEIVI